MALRLFVLTSNQNPPPSVLILGRRALIGRGVKVDVRLPDPSVSLHHATIVKRGNAYLLTDDHSTHGTGVARPEMREPVWLAPDSPRVIEDGEHIWIGQIELEARLEAATRGKESGYEELAPTLVAAGLTAVGIEPTQERVRETLIELSELPEEKFEPPEPSTPEEREFSSFFEEDQRHPPWKTDLFVALLALVILLSCALGMMNVLGAT